MWRAHPILLIGAWDGADLVASPFAVAATPQVAGPMATYPPVDGGVKEREACRALSSPLGCR